MSVDDRAALAGQRILVTRPDGRAGDLIAAIAAAGGEALHVPLLAVEPLDATRDAESWQRTERNLRQFAKYRRIIAISVNAVHYGLAWLERLHGTELAARSDVRWYGIGAASAAELARWGIDARGGGDGATSEALLALPELQQVQGESILILRGVGGRETLAGVLRSRGADVAYAECYRRAAPTLDESQRQLLQRGGFDAICVNSAETLHNLVEVARAAARYDAYAATPLLVPSARVASLAAEAGFARVLVAANAGTEATLAALCARRG
jgi:uroporphyrinogen-III synthase